MNLKLDQALDRGVFAIKQLQLPDGSFSDINFYTGLILRSLSIINHPDIQKIRSAGEDFLLSQHSHSYTYNYWKSPKIPLTKKNYPDDLDDTSVCLSALSLLDETFVDEDVLFSFVTILIKTEKHPGGPYNTWIIHDYENTDWCDIDLGVNINIGYFLSIQKIHLSNLISFIETRIKNNNFESKYYHKKIAFLYFLSPWYRGELVDHLKTILLSEFLSRTESLPVQDIAQAISAYIRLGGSWEHVTTPRDYLIHHQCHDGTWSPDPFFIEEIINGIPCYSESRAFATACAMEALSLCKEHYSQPKQEEDPEPLASRDTKIKDSILLEQNHLPDEIQKQLAVCISEITSHDKNYEVTLLPYFFTRSLKNLRSISDEIILQLCKASLYGWIAYTLYDDIMDNEPKRDFLPLANICMRNLVSIYTDLDASDLVTDILETMEHANLYERKNYYAHSIIDTAFTIPSEIPTYQTLDNLAHKSYGHVLAPIFITRLTHTTEHEQDIRNFFTDYLIARQLNDDAHDWLDDLQRGFINPAGSLLLKKYHGLFPHQKSLDLASDSSDVLILKRIFWESVIDEISAEIINHVSRARLCLEHASRFISPQYFEPLLNSLETSAQSAVLNKKFTEKLLIMFK